MTQNQLQDLQDKQEQEQIDAFCDPRFGSVDYVTQREKRRILEASEDDLWAPDPKFAPHEDPMPISLRQFVNSADLSVLQEVAERSGPEAAERLREEIRNEREDAAARQFVKTHPEYFKDDDNYEILKSYLANHELAMTPQTLHEAYEWALSEGFLRLSPGVSKELTRAEKLTVARIAQAGDVPGAIEEYLKFALPGTTSEQLLDVISDPDYLPLCNESVYFTFINSTPGYIDNETNRSFIEDYCGDRPFNLNLLQAAFEELKKAQLVPPEPDELSPENADKRFEELPDEELAKLMHASIALRSRRR